MQLLVGDVGGTHTRLALVDNNETVARRTVRSEPDGSLWSAIEAFIKDHGGKPAAACLGVAGPVRRGRVRLTNLGWLLDEEELGERLGVPFRLINDFHAQALAMPRLSPEHYEQLCGGAPHSDLPIAVLGAGTGLGEAFLVPMGTGYVAIPTEGGHARFAPRGTMEWELTELLAARYGHVSVERILSGPGLAAIYDFLRGDEPLHPEMETEDVAAAVSRRALAGSCPICEAALDLFVGVYGDEAANLALKCNAGAVYVTGGIAPQILPAMRRKADGRGGFHASFVAKGRYREWLETVPVRVVLHPDPGLLGAQVGAEALLRR